MTRLGFVVDATLCMGCDACSIACKDEFVGNDFAGYSAAQPDPQYGYYPGPTVVDGGAVNPRAWTTPGQKWMDRVEVVRGTFPNLKVTTYPLMCQNCDNCPLVTSSPNGAAYMRPDGIVLIDPNKAFGQTKLPAQCPYNVVFWNAAANIAQKCTFCAHLVDQGKNPKCVDMCHMSAITFGDLDTPNSRVSALVASGKAEVLHPEFGTKPRVYYIGLPKTFLMGKVADAKTGAYLEGATVVVVDSKNKQTSTVVDNYGDFVLDGLTAGETYNLTVSLSGYKSSTQTVPLKTDTYIGDVALTSQ